jgi:hypothetical protein
MRIIKLAIISVIVIFLILTAMSALLPSHTLVSRAVDIRGSISKTKEQAFYLQNWKNWLTDARGQKAEHSYNDSVLSVGETTVSPVTKTDSSFTTSWVPGNNMISILRIIDHHSPDSLITVQWQMEQKVRWYPWEKFASITKDELWGGAMERSLENLKTIIETR